MKRSHEAVMSQVKDGATPISSIKGIRCAVHATLVEMERIGLIDWVEHCDPKNATCELVNGIHCAIIVRR